jgi:hypothetical protein
MRQLQFAGICSHLHHAVARTRHAQKEKKDICPQRLCNPIFMIEFFERDYLHFWMPESFGFRQARGNVYRGDRVVRGL